MNKSDEFPGEAEYSAFNPLIFGSLSAEYIRKRRPLSGVWQSLTLNLII